MHFSAATCTAGTASTRPPPLARPPPTRARFCQDFRARTRFPSVRCPRRGDGEVPPPPPIVSSVSTDPVYPRLRERVHPPPSPLRITVSLFYAPGNYTHENVVSFFSFSSSFINTVTFRPSTTRSRPLIANGKNWHIKNRTKMSTTDGEKPRCRSSDIERKKEKK